MNIKNVLAKQGGAKLLFKQYAKAGALPATFFELLTLGKSRTALEIIRLSYTLKVKNKLKRKYKKVLTEFDATYDDTLEHKSSDYIWICWLQGMENAPAIVQKCYQSVVKNNPNKEVVLLTDENIHEWVTFPAHIKEKYEKGMITKTHLSDLLRLELLIRYGGTWMDATVFCSANQIPDYFFDSDLFFFQTLKPGRDGKANYLSSWFITAKTNNKILMATRALCYAYWETNNLIWDYFLLHDFCSIVLDLYEEEWRAIIPRDNETPHLLLLRLFDEYDERMWNAIMEQTPFHKLTYKFSQENSEKPDTNYKKLMEIAWE